MIYSLYKKTHNQTGLQYLGYTKKNPHKYKGSGIKWLSHIKYHGHDVETEILLQTSDIREIEKIGAHYSQLWNIVESKEWANLKPETGDGGGVPKMNKGKSRPKEHIEAMKKGWANAKVRGYRVWNKGLTGLKGPCQPITLVAPNGTKHHYESMKKGCRENNLVYAIMSGVKNGKVKHHKGWTIE
jgi:hypothetical protein